MKYTPLDASDARLLRARHPDTGQRHRPQQPRPARLELYAKHRGRAGRAEQCTEPKKQIDSKVLRQAIQRQQDGRGLADAQRTRAQTLITAKSECGAPHSSGVSVGKLCVSTRPCPPYVKSADARDKVVHQKQSKLGVAMAVGSYSSVTGAARSLTEDGSPSC